MTSRERMLAAFNYADPDRIPVVYHPSPAGLHVHGTKLLDLFKRYPPDNPICFDSMPLFPPGAVAPNGEYREVKTDEWGTVWEHRIFGVHGIPSSYPFASWREAAGYRFPPVPETSKAGVAEQRRRFLMFDGWISIFEKLHALRPMDEVLVDIQLRDPAWRAFLDRMVEYWAAVIQNLLAADVDVIVFGDDWGAQGAPLVSPAVFREVFRPRYERLMQPIHRAGKIVFFHSCGYLGEILDDLLDMGVRGLWPQIRAFDADPANLEKCRERRVAIYIHPDRQYLVPRGSPAEIEAAVRDYAERYRRLHGGGIFYIEVENDAPFENVSALIEAVQRYR